MLQGKRNLIFSLQHLQINKINFPPSEMKTKALLIVTALAAADFELVLKLRAFKFSSPFLMQLA